MLAFLLWFGVRVGLRIGVVYSMTRGDVALAEIVESAEFRHDIIFKRRRVLSDVDVCVEAEGHDCSGETNSAGLVVCVSVMPLVHVDLVKLGPFGLD